MKPEAALISFPGACIAEASPDVLHNNRALQFNDRKHGEHLSAPAMWVVEGVLLLRHSPGSGIPEKV